MYYIKKIYLYKNTHLPKDGWLQGCFNCQQITSKVYFYRKLTRKENIYEFYFFKCNSCGREFKKCSTKRGISEDLSFREGTFISITASL